jgi:hypothetical protein
MALLSVKEFSEVCGDKAKSIEVWILRGKVVSTYVGNKKMIDADNLVNALFIQQRKEVHEQKELLGEVVKPVVIEKIVKTRAKVPEKVKVIVDRPLKSKAEKPEKFPVEHGMTDEMKREEAKRMNDQNLRAAIKIDQEAQMRQQTIDMQELRIQSEKIRLDKTAGNLLPIDLTMGVIERCVNSVLKTFEKDFERIGDIYANFAGLDPTSRTDFIKECRVALSISVENAGKSAQAEIDILVDNYAETLMIGQKKA